MTFTAALVLVLASVSMLASAEPVAPLAPRAPAKRSATISALIDNVTNTRIFQVVERASGTKLPVRAFYHFD